MPTFAYRVKEVDGRDSKGWVEADSEETLIQLLHQQGKVILSVERQESPRGKAAGETALRLIEPRVRHQELMLFTTQLSAMMDAGLPLLRSLNVLTQETENLRLKRILNEVALQIEAGSSFSQALARHRLFGNLFVSLARAGEISGRLNETLRQLARYLEGMEDIRKKIKSALSYPIFLLGFSLLIVVILVTWLIPAFAQVYDKFKAQIPGPTLAMMDASRFAREHGVQMLLGAALLGLATWLFLRTEPGRFLRDRMLLGIPWVGPLVLRSILARFSRTLGVLVGAGIPFLDALDLVTQASDNRLLRRALGEAFVAIQGGSTIAKALDQTGFFPRMLVSMIASGEEVGALPQMLTKGADFYDQQVDSSIKGLMSVLEPIMILLLGGMIGGILLAMYLPVFTLGRAIR
jgi:type IV pilus assembly protein PilC